MGETVGYYIDYILSYDKQTPATEMGWGLIPSTIRRERTDWS